MSKQRYVILEYIGESSDGSCGYCKNIGSRGKLGVWAHQLSSNAYQQMLDRGWRRSGCYLYKPTMDKTCCPQYTIRLDVDKFFMSRSQRRVMRQMNEFLQNDKRPRCAVKEEADRKVLNIPTKYDKMTTNSSDSNAKKEKTSEQMKKKDMRRQRCFKRWVAKGLDVEEMKEKHRKQEDARKRTVESYLSREDDSWKHHFEVRLVKVKSEEHQQREEESFRLFQKYQLMVHKDRDTSIRGYHRFLVDTPIFSDEAEVRIEPACGSYHQWYLLDDRLIAVGVIDILPNCVSSKYMFYDPEYNFLSLGTYTALREIAFTRELMKSRPELHYYYMGYYIDSCPKMRYKGKFRPSELLCDFSFEWVPLEDCQKLLMSNEGRFTAFKPNIQPKARATVNDLTLLVDRTAIPFTMLEDYKRGLSDNATIRKKLESFARLIVPGMKDLVLYLPDLNKQCDQESDEDLD